MLDRSHVVAIRKRVRNGERAEDIAVALGVPKSHVYYLAKKHKIRLRRGFDDALQERNQSGAQFFRDAVKKGWTIVRMAAALGLSLGCVHHRYRAYLISKGVLRAEK